MKTNILLLIVLLILSTLTACKFEDAVNKNDDKGKVKVEDTTSDTGIKKIIAVYGQTKYGKSVYGSIK